MKRFVLGAWSVWVVGLGLSLQARPPVASRAVASPGAGLVQATAPASPGQSAAAPGAPAEPPDHNGLVRQYCATCHSDRGRAGGLSLAGFDIEGAADQAAISEKMIRKLRAGMMPPAGARRPEPEVLAGLADSLETRVDLVAAARPNPGWRPFQRLNRAEYARAIHDLLALDIDVGALLPPDTISHGFDNVADAQTFSPTLMEGYLRAASRVTALAVGDREAEAAEAHYRVPKTASQRSRVDGAPFGTRGGVSVVHTFPADGEYVFRMELHGNACGFLFGAPTTGEQLEVSIDGERRALIAIDTRMAEVTTGLLVKSAPLHVKAGAHRVTAAFLQQFEGPVNDLLAPIDHTLADTQIGVSHGITTLPHLKDLAIAGPLSVTGVSETASRRRIFDCRPTVPGEEAGCAAQIVRRLATQAFRRPVDDRDFERLMRFYETEREARDFEAGIAAALEAILASPQFLFRLEPVPATARAGEPHRIGDLALASRLSYFLWGAAPDDELVALADAGTLRSPEVLDAQVARMLADPRAEALSTRFAAQWLRLHDVDLILPDAIAYPYFDRTLGDALVKETELFFDSLVREDRSVLDLLTADYTFVNERVARHYGLPNVIGQEFRRVPLPPERRGILGHGSVLVLTSVADRTSPVMRGKWVMEVLLGSPPPPPPPNVPSLEDSVSEAEAGRRLTVRERLEEHRRNPACASCHRVIDPLGLALENYDVTGRWRIKDAGVDIDASGELYDGTPIDGPQGLRDAILKHKAVFLASFTESLMTYALGRRLEPYDMPAVRRIIAGAADQQYKMSSFVQGIVDSAAFQMSTPGEVGTAAPGQP